MTHSQAFVHQQKKIMADPFDISILIGTYLMLMPVVPWHHHFFKFYNVTQCLQQKKGLLKNALLSNGTTTFSKPSRSLFDEWIFTNFSKNLILYIFISRKVSNFKVLDIVSAYDENIPSLAIIQLAWSIQPVQYAKTLKY